MANNIILLVGKTTWLNICLCQATQTAFRKLPAFGIQLKKFLVTVNSAVSQVNTKRVPISALSSGIGPACMAIIVNEASRVGVHTFIRVGSTGAIQKGIDCGDLIISIAAVRHDCTSNCYVMPEYPAVDQLRSFVGFD